MCKLGVTGSSVLKMKGTASSSRQGDLGGGPGGVRRKVMVAKVGGCHDDERKGFMKMC